MLYLSSGSSSLRGYPACHGTILGPRTRGMLPIKEGRPWAGDNDAFHGLFSEKAFLKHLRRLMPYRHTCLFITAPDVVCNAPETMRLYREWAPRLHELGFPVAWVAQNGATPQDIPLDCEAVFIGGDTAWKLGSEALAVCQAARALGKHVHMGRVNSARRARLAASMGVDSVDGTYTAFRGQERGLKTISAWMEQAREAREQPRLL